jgi:hypothetical protein
MSPHEEREPGFAGLVEGGMDAEVAWQQIRDGYAADPGALAVIERMKQDPEGRAVLAWSRMMWAGYGLPPPWEEPEQCPPTKP